MIWRAANTALTTGSKKSSRYDQTSCMFINVESSIQKLTVLSVRMPEKKSVNRQRMPAASSKRGTATNDDVAYTVNLDIKEDGIGALEGKNGLTPALSAHFEYFYTAIRQC